MRKGGKFKKVVEKAISLPVEFPKDAWFEGVADISTAGRAVPWATVPWAAKGYLPQRCQINRQRLPTLLQLQALVRTIFATARWEVQSTTKDSLWSRCNCRVSCQMLIALLTLQLQKLSGMLPLAVEGTAYLAVAIVAEERFFGGWLNCLTCSNQYNFCLQRAPLSWCSPNSWNSSIEGSHLLLRALLFWQLQQQHQRESMVVYYTTHPTVATATWKESCRSKKGKFACWSYCSPGGSVEGILLLFRELLIWQFHQQYVWEPLAVHGTSHPAVAIAASTSFLSSFVRKYRG